MAHLWVRDEAEQWAVLPLEHEAFTLAASPPKPIPPLSRESDAPSRLRSVVLVRAPAANGNTEWVLIAGSNSLASVNGIPLVTGIRVVEDRDQIRVPDGCTVYFSTETLARVEGFSGPASMFCPRCKQEIEGGSDAVKCPSCGVWHHQSPELNCWTYSDVCALCAQSTDLEGKFRWTPEEL
ncbi:MAG: RING finger protein [Blastocatellia bacterium]